MKLRNSQTTYGLVAVFLHWLVALTVAGMFGLGYWMVGLTYYDAWYKQGPDIHRSAGVLLFIAMLLRVVWRLMNLRPEPVPGHRRWEVIAAHIAHGLLYVLLFVAMTSGYLISTADGSSVNVFGWFHVPSLTGRIKGMEDIAGVVHYWVTWSVVVLAGIHAFGALKHHFIDRDNTLRRMLGR
jgi:cytochrome b561